MTVNLTLTGVREAMAAAVAERGPDYDYKAVHDSCRYTFYEQVGDAAVLRPGCLVGDVVHRLGVSLETLAVWNDSGCGDLLEHLCDAGFIEYADGEAAEYVPFYLATAQEIQDVGGEGHTWGDALRIAEGTLGGPDV
jgi:hypothetical protein